MKKTVSQMTKEERERAAMVIGTTILMLEEKRSIIDIGKEVGLDAWQVDSNIREMLYHIRRHLGKTEAIKEILFIK